MMQFATGATSDVGRVRAANEDHFTVGGRLAAVADGMGGHVGGALASSLAVAVCHELSDVPGLRPEDLLDGIQRANQAVLTRAGAEGLIGMGTTLAGVAVVDVGGVEHYAVFNVGDSRVYRFAEGRLEPMTVDHSEVQDLVIAGQLTASEARVHPGRNVITRSVGTVPPPVPDLWVFPPRPPERFLLCSDGLTSEVTDEAIAAVLGATADPQRAADELVDAAVTAGGRDNVTVVVVDPVLPAPPVDAPTTPRSRATEVTA